MSATVSTLLSFLEQETALVIRFVSVLQDEAKVLEDGAAGAALTETTQQRNELTDALTDVAAQRNACLSELGFGTDGQGLEAAARAHPELAAAKDELLRQTEQAKTLNEANGRIIEVYLDHNQRTLDTLRRLAGVGDIYDASGRTRPTGANKGRNIKAG